MLTSSRAPIKSIIAALAVGALLLTAPRSGDAADAADAPYTLFVPSQEPAAGYALMVFVPPWSEARLPRGWQPVLERWGVIFVTAAGSGNKANVVTRRMPLALAAARDVMARYRVDPDLVLIAGFSGGSRVALRLAIAHPELFHGVLLNAGSDPIDDADRPIPPPPLLRLFQERTRLVYVTGEQDGINRDLDHQSRASLDRWCVFAVEDQPMSGRGHVVADAFALDQALATLLAPQAPPDRDKLDACRAGLPER